MHLPQAVAECLGAKEGDELEWFPATMNIEMTTMSLNDMVLVRTKRN